MTFPTEKDARDFMRTMGITGPVIIPTTHGHWTLTSAKVLDRDPQICSICKEPFREFSNNAKPVNNGRCCAYCDERVVTPARIRLAELRDLNVATD